MALNRCRQAGRRSGGVIVDDNDRISISAHVPGAVRCPGG